MGLSDWPQSSTDVVADIQVTFLCRWRVDINAKQRNKHENFLMPWLICSCPHRITVMTFVIFSTALTWSCQFLSQSNFTPKSVLTSSELTQETCASLSTRSSTYIRPPSDTDYWSCFNWLQMFWNYTYTEQTRVIKMSGPYIRHVWSLDSCRAHDTHEYKHLSAANCSWCQGQISKVWSPLEQHGQQLCHRSSESLCVQNFARQANEVDGSSNTRLNNNTNSSANVNQKVPQGRRAGQAGLRLGSEV